MNSSDASVERRKDSRLDIKKMAFVVLPESKMNVCRLIDISKGGLAFIYSLTDFELNFDLRQIDILCDDFSYIKGVKTKIVSNITLDGYPTFNQTIMKRCGVQFLDISEKKAKELEDFQNRME